MSEHRERFGDTHIAVISFAEQEQLSVHRRAMLERDQQVAEWPDMAWLSDPERRVYRAFQLSRTSVWRVYNPGTLRMYAGLLRRGRRMRKPVDDTRQLGGDAIFAPNGSLHKVFRPASPDARPSMDELVDAVEASRLGKG